LTESERNELRRLRKENIELRTDTDTDTDTDTEIDADVNCRP
jgi:hypothetical protein